MEEGGETLGLARGERVPHTLHQSWGGGGRGEGGGGGERGDVMMNRDLLVSLGIMMWSTSSGRR